MITLTANTGSTKLVATLVGSSLQVRERRELPTPANKTLQTLYTTLQTLVAPLQERVNRVAIASTGIIRKRTLLALNPHSPDGLMHFPLTQMLGQITDLPTLAVNDVQAAAWAECHALSGEYRGLVLITVSTSMSGGIVGGGRLLTKVDDLAEHLRHTLADPRGPMCDYGRVGCVEAIASGRGIAEAAESALAGCDARITLNRAGQGDEQAGRLTHRSVRTLARLVADVEATTDCQCVVIGDSVRLAEEYLALVKHYLAQESLTYHVGLLAAHYRHDAGLLGAALLAQGE